MPHASQLARAQVVEAEARFELWGLAGGKMHVREANFCESPEVGEVLRRADVVLVNNEVCVVGPLPSLARTVENRMAKS
mgnify:CR=1 FL=1|jgi:H3 lysine-79-specific histone-lysine N-methyltransferase